MEDPLAFPEISPPYCPAPPHPPRGDLDVIDLARILTTEGLSAVTARVLIGLFRRM